MSCRFCDLYELERKANKGEPPYYMKYYVIWENGCSLVGEGYDRKNEYLRFCPECGRRLKAIKVKKDKNLKITTCKMCVYYERMGVPGVAEAIGSCPLGTISDSKDMQHECKLYRADEGEV